VIEVSLGVVAATLEAFRDCGHGRRECVVYWVADREGQRVVRASHPKHTATWSGYQVAGAWVTAFFLELARRHERVVGQVHTHPHDRVGMSGTDDRYVLLPSAGFLSAVVPNFGDSDDRAGWGIWVLAADGTWDRARGEITWTSD
jgi:proteasome lid subunit RPN8/RPN11